MPKEKVEVLVEGGKATALRSFINFILIDIYDVPRLLELHH